MTDELVINETNFKQYFRDCRQHQPERGDIVAKYIGSAEFIDGQMKKDVIDLLLNREKARAAVQVMQKLGFATYSEAIRICKEIANDLGNGMTETEVENKVYPYDIEMFFYTKKEYVPTDPHWSIITLNNLDDFIDNIGQKLHVDVKIIEKESEE